jgi:hypothetical protein
MRRKRACFCNQPRMLGAASRTERRAALDAVVVDVVDFVVGGGDCARSGDRLPDESDVELVFVLVPLLTGAGETARAGFSDTSSAAAAAPAAAAAAAVGLLVVAVVVSFTDATLLLMLLPAVVDNAALGAVGLRPTICSTDWYCDGSRGDVGMGDVDPNACVRALARAGRGEHAPDTAMISPQRSVSCSAL